MAFLKTVREITMLLAAEFLTKSLMAVGLFLFILGGIIAYVIVSFVMRWLGFEASTITAVSVIVTILTSLLGIGLFGVGIGLLLWARKSNHDITI